MISKEKVIATFVNTSLEGEYNFLQDDLIKLAHAFIDAAEPEIINKEKNLCIEIVRAYNPLVADKLEEVRSRK
jgi:hypothetical protein